MYKISVIIPIYNVERYIVPCLDSIVGQATEEIEIICVEDCSRDQSYEILCQYVQQHPFIKIIKHTKNQGLSAARNSGLSQAQGEYILFVDSDDMLKENAIDILLAYIKKEKFDILTFNYDVMIEGEQYSNKIFGASEQNKTYKRYKNGCEWLIFKIKNHNLEVVAWNKLYRKSFLTENNLEFLPDIVHEDNLFCIESFLLAGTVIDISQMCYTYRKRADSITSKVYIRHLESKVIIYRRLMYLLQSYEKSEEIHCAINIYIESIVRDIVDWMHYFPEHLKMLIGGAEDQMLYDTFRFQLNIKNRWVHFSVSEIEKMKKAEEIFIYGAGRIGIEVLRTFEILEIEVSAFIVSDRKDNPDNVKGYAVIPLECLNEKEGDHMLIVIAVKRCGDIIHQLEKRQMKNYICAVKE